MKGVPAAPRCGFSKKAVSMLQGAGVEFGHIDVMSEPDTRRQVRSCCCSIDSHRKTHQHSVAVGRTFLADVLLAGD